jgi:hypothetical protein
MAIKGQSFASLPDSVLIAVEKQPEFPGGILDFLY